MPKPKKTAVMSNTKKLSAPVKHFDSAGGRRFTVGRGEHESRHPDDALWSDHWPILLDGKIAGRLFRNLSYGQGPTGKPRWQATTRELFWSHASDAPTGIGFDVAALDTAEEALAAWGRKADEILDWEAGRPVPSIYSKTGVFQRKLDREKATARFRAMSNRGTTFGVVSSGIVVEARNPDELEANTDREIVRRTKDNRRN